MSRAAAMAARVGFRAHTGWAALVVVAGTPSAPVVVERRKIEMIAGHAANQPPFVYHAAKLLAPAAAARLIRDAEAQSLARATDAIAALVDRLADRYALVAGGIIVGDRRPSPSLATILASHSAIHTAEGELYRDALAKACAAAKLPVTEMRARDLNARAAALFGIAAAKVPDRLTAIGRAAGRPWARDQKDAFVAALAARP